jgi:hypothetical protein
VVRTYSADSLEQIVMRELDLHGLAMGENGEDFRVGHVHISPEGVAAGIV